MNHKTISEYLEKRNDVLYVLAEKLTSLSAGCLALTVTFRRDILSGNNDVWILKMAWGGFILVVIAFVLLYLARMELYRRVIDSAISNNLFISGKQPWYFKLAFYALFLGFLTGIGSLAFYGFTH